MQKPNLSMSDDTALQAHWRFAAANAFRALETQVREFDFARNANSHTYSGLKPNDYIEIIDGFLSEDSTIVPGGDRLALEELRKFLVHHIASAFGVGWQTAVENWNDGRSEYGSLSTPELHSVARNKSPFSGVKQEWFIEGYCQSWAHSEVESLRNLEPPTAS
tara:strand:- start:8198 stop:8686 length:489 start_codon:yes stop_codon:yes gene_type:complete